jgi:DNA-binding NarL/FixJ family response regulator
LLIGSAATRPAVVESLGRLGYVCGEAEDPYVGMMELCRRSLVYQAVILSLASLYREELPIIRAIKRRFPHAEVWLAHTDGRQATLAEAMRLGADGLLDSDGLHRIAVGGISVETAEPSRVEERSFADTARSDLPRETKFHDLEPDDLDTSDEPILSADELKALLHEQPTSPHAGDEAES